MKKRTKNTYCLKSLYHSVASSFQKYPILLSVVAIAGKFYKIEPHLIIINGKTRGDFGIHADRNVPGTAGCIGIESELEWKGFKNLMAAYKRAGLQEVPLLVSYR